MKIYGLLKSRPESLSRRESTTLYMTLLAAFQTLLGRDRRQTDICVGLTGPFINTLPLRCYLTGDPTFLELLSRIREVAAGAYDHQILPLERIIEIVHCKPSLNHHPLFQVCNFLEISARPEGLDVAAFDFDAGVAAFDLTLELTEPRIQLECVLNFNTALFDVGTARGMLGHYQTLLEAS